MTPPILVALARKHRATAAAIVGDQLASNHGNFAENIWADGTLQNTGYLAAAALFGIAGV